MKRGCFPFKSTCGFTTIELIIVVAILYILVSMANLSYSTLQSRARFSKIVADMNAIGISAYNDFSTNGVWSPMYFGNFPDPPPLVVTGQLKAWPNAPCPGWYYSWEDWTGYSDSAAVQVTLRRANNTLLWGYCVDTGGGAGGCQIIDPIVGGAVATDVSTVTDRHIYCGE